MHKVIIDTDIGDDIDDAIALALAVKDKNIELKGVITTYRNVKLRSKVALALLEEWGRTDIPVYMGMDDPLQQEYYFFPFEQRDENGKPIIRHYQEYMQDFLCQEGNSLFFLANLVRQYPKQITLVAIGPLTNIALFYQKYPQEYGFLKEIIIMGGRFDKDCAEWNIQCDPEAADIVLRSEAVIRLVPLDVTLQCVFNHEQVVQLRSENAGNQRLNKMIDIWLKDTEHISLPILHDPLALSCVFADFCAFTDKQVRVLLDGQNRGKTVFDEVNGKKISVALSVQAEKFTQYVCENIVRKI